MAGNNAINNEVKSTLNMNGNSLQNPTNITSSAGLPVLSFNYAASATEYLQLSNSNNSGAGFQIVTADADGSVFIQGKGTGGVLIGTSGSTTIPMEFQVNAFKYTFSVPTLTATRVITFPDAGVTLVAGTMAPTVSPVFTTPTLGAATATSITFSPTTGGIVGTTTNDNAGAGKVGEYVESVILTGSATSITRNTPTNLTSISLTAGDWDVWGNFSLATLGTTPTDITAGISTTSATLPDNALIAQINLVTGTLGVNTAVAPPMRRMSLSATTTVYMIGYLGNVSGNGTMCGLLAARRVR